MLDFLHDNSIFVVLGITLIIWGGIVSYMLSLDKKVKKLEELTEE
jgi:CcmD family protein